MEKKIKSSFGKNLFKIRKEKSLSQEKLSNLTGISQRMIAYYEKQAINPPLDKIEIIRVDAESNFNIVLELNYKTVFMVNDLLPSWFQKLNRHSHLLWFYLIK